VPSERNQLLGPLHGLVPFNGVEGLEITHHFTPSRLSIKKKCDFFTPSFRKRGSR